MAKIIASGKRGGEKMTVEVIDGETYVDALKDDAYDPLIYEQHVMGGTYYAEPGSMENALNTLAHHFFDEDPTIITTGKFEEMPHEKDRIY